MDRADLQYAAKEMAKHMANPCNLDWAKVKRVGRYLLGAPRYVQQYLWQEFSGHIDAFSDSDWAGDRVTRKSTSGGVLMMGSHLLKSWASTQPVIALSSGEAELYALVRTAAQAKGMASLLMDYNMSTTVTVHTDSTAAIGIVHRKGLGKTRHIETQYLWIQESVGNKSIAIKKVGTKENPADMLTKGLKREPLNEHVKNVGGYTTSVKAKSALSLGAVQLSDSWDAADDRLMIRRHNKWRECFFTPMKVAGGPKRSSELQGYRCTIGKYKSGKSFTIMDDWVLSSEPHRRLQEAWIGHTIFIIQN